MSLLCGKIRRSMRVNKPLSNSRVTSGAILFEQHWHFMLVGKMFLLKCVIPHVQNPTPTME